MEQFRLYKGGWVNIVPHNAERIDRSKASGLMKKGGKFVKNVYNWDKKEDSSFWYVI